MRILAGDRVAIEMSPYDLTRGHYHLPLNNQRKTWRDKK